MIKLIPRHLIIKCVDIYKADKHCSAYKTYDQLVSLFHLWSVLSPHHLYVPYND
ncbi:hypothetical protein [Pedobacter alpinus]|uniref:hypothetical protein n=1 Tax=Pedobacter alpinus TaxID=1590643 RepID=UPI003610C0A0